MRVLLTAACLSFVAVTIINVSRDVFPTFDQCLNHEGIVQDCYHIYGDLK